MSLVAAMALPVWLDVSRETHERLREILQLVGKWNPAVNLVGSGSLSQGWERHVLDSAQLFGLAEVEGGLWADLGSGGGFPGLVVAALALEKAPDLRFALVESDRRKAAFLAQVVRGLGLKAQILCDRAERLDPLQADVLSARAFAPLDQLCVQAARHLKPEGVAIFPKGGNHGAELALAAKTWAFDHRVVPSRTDASGAILVMRNIRHG